MASAFKTASDWPEADYRKQVTTTLDQVSRAFEEIDPDQVECELRFGVLTLLFPNRTKIILSAQPAVRQLWLALAAQGTAYHFGWDVGRAQWRDDKGRDVEVLSLLSEVLEKTSGIRISF